jgi:hypothetical protein
MPTKYPRVEASVDVERRSDDVSMMLMDGSRVHDVSSDESQ